MRVWVLAVMMLLVASMASAGTVKLTWDAVDGAMGYKVYVDGQLSQATIKNHADVVVVNGKRVFYVTAYNEWGESAPSNTVTTPDVAGVPANVKLVITIDATQGTGK